MRPLVRKGWQQRFLKALRDVPSVANACRKSGVSYPRAYALRAEDSEFRNQWDEAVKAGVGALEDAAWRRAKSGKSDTLAIFLLKAHDPERYREKQSLALTGPGGEALPAPATTVVAPTVIFVQPKKDELGEGSIEVAATKVLTNGGSNGH